MGKVYRETTISPSFLAGISFGSFCITRVAPNYKDLCRDLIEIIFISPFF